jgi:phosphoribosylanthranilate isomerase
MAGFKICGITNEADLELALSVRPNMVGFVVSDSPRRVEPERTQELIKHTQGRAETVVVTTSKNLEEINELLETLKPRLIQLHSEIKDMEEIKARKIGVVKVDGKIEKLIEKTKGLTSMCDYVLFDTGAGTGKTHDWTKTRVLKEIAGDKTILAGGLNPENVSEAIQAVNPFMVDVSSGVEIEPGKKDPEKVRVFAERVRRAYGL